MRKFLDLALDGSRESFSVLAHLVAIPILIKPCIIGVYDLYYFRFCTQITLLIGNRLIH